MDFSITIGIATKARPNLLLTTLAEVAKQCANERSELNIIIYNDDINPLDKCSFHKPEFQCLSILFIEGDVTSGLPHARNRIIEACTTDYLIFLDDDDKWPPEFYKNFVQNSISLNRNASIIVGYNDPLLYLRTKHTNTQMFIEEFYSPPVGTQIYNIKKIDRSLLRYNLNIKSGVDHDLFLTLHRYKIDMVLIYTKHLSCLQSLTDERITTNISNRRAEIRNSMVFWQNHIRSIDADYWVSLTNRYDNHTNYKEFRKAIVSRRPIALIKAFRPKNIKYLAFDILYRIFGFRIGKKLW